MLNADLSPEKLLANHLPSRRTEGWQYTDVNLLRTSPFHPLPSPVCLDESYKKYLISKHYLIFQDGYLKAYALPEHVLLKPFKKNFYKITDFPDVFETLNKNHAPAPYVLTILPESGTFLDSLHVLYVISPQTDRAWAQTRLVLNITSPHKIRVVESFFSFSPVIVNAVTVLNLGPFSEVDYIKIQKEHPQTFHVGQLYLNLEKSTRIKTLTLSEGGQLGRSAIEASLQAKNARCELYGFSRSQGFSCLDHPVLIEHKAAHTHSEQYYQGILKDCSRTVFKGKIRVYPEAHHAFANQKSHYLILSDEAEVDARPELEIYQDDVQCTHGAAIGCLDAQALFYLRTRGLDIESAQALLIEAYENHVLQRYTHQDSGLENLLNQARKKIL